MKKRNWKRKLHNGFLWTVTYSAFILFVLSVASMDTDSWFPTLTMFGSLAWLLLFSLANEERW